MPRNEETICTKLHRIEELASRDMTMQFTSLAHLLTPKLLTDSFQRLNQKGAPGVDGVTMEGFKENLDVNIQELIEELKSKRYRASNVRRKGIPKAGGKVRQLGIPEVDKTFDFLGFTHYRRARVRRNKRYYTVAVKPCRKSRNSFLLRIKEWLRKVMHTSVWFQAKCLRRKLIGYYNYFGLKNCLPALARVLFHVRRIWIQTLRRRSQKSRLSWERFLQKPWVKILPSPYPSY